MGQIKLTVIYPLPTDVETFEKEYNEVHVPMAVGKLLGKTKIVATKVLQSPHGTPSVHRIAEIHFPSIAALEACLASPGGQETAAHAVSISSGGTPSFLVTEEEVYTFQS
ncbi:MAG TPA: EthD family reductase [Terriglobia bacterium]